MVSIIRIAGVYAGDLSRIYAQIQNPLHGGSQPRVRLCFQTLRKLRHLIAKLRRSVDSRILVVVRDFVYDVNHGLLREIRMTDRNSILTGASDAQAAALCLFAFK